MGHSRAVFDDQVCDGSCTVGEVIRNFSANYQNRMLSAIWGKNRHSKIASDTVSISTKNVGVTLIRYTSYFSYHNRFLAYDPSLSRYNFKTEAQSPKPTIFLESWVRNDSRVTGLEKNFRWKYSGTECFTNIPKFMSTKIGDFEVFFCKELISWPNGQFLSDPSPIIGYACH